EQVEAAPVVEDLDLDLGEVDLGSLLAGDTQVGPPEQDEPEDAADSGEDPDGAPAEPHSDREPELTGPSGHLVLSELGEMSWALIETLTAALAAGDIAEVVADLDGLDAESEVGATYRELIADMTSAAGVQLCDPDRLPIEPVEADTNEDATSDAGRLEVLDAEPGPAVEDLQGDRMDEEIGAEPAAPKADPDGDEDGFNFGFQAPPMVRGGL